MFNSKALLTSTLAALASIAAATPVGPVTENTGDRHRLQRRRRCRMCGASRPCPTHAINLTGGLSFLNKEISTAVVPGGMICTFFQDFGCTASGVVNAGTDSQVFLGQGTWNFFAVPGLSGTTNFNDLTSSFTCSPI
ncbi:hypothetical protein B0H14DRAFT_3903635 [Mycena olivaceomarginata]|nr:hypothetical protein B0H14DRAFT_3903635 [Mycena olivaceomarginata]